MLADPSGIGRPAALEDDLMIDRRHPCFSGMADPVIADPVIADPGTAELQLGIPSCRNADASVAGVFTFRMAPISF